MQFPVIEKIAGTTLKVTANLNGAAAGPIVSSLFDRAEALVSSVTASDSGDGYYYALHLLPNTSAYYVNKWHMVINGNTYVETQFVRARLPEVD